MRELVLVGFCLSLITGCAVVDQGMIDYRRADTKPTGVENIGAALGSPRRPLALSARNLSSTNSGSSIAAGDNITISLSAAFLRDFPELAITPQRAFSRGLNISRGEILILAKVYEARGPNDAQAGQDINWVNLDDANVIYFSRDIEEQQWASMSNLPIYGPRPYAGRALRIELHMIEVDQHSQQMVDALHALSSVATGPIAAALSSPVVGRLSQEFLDSNSNDVFFSFIGEFSPGVNDGGPTVPRLEEGQYVYIRQHDRTSAIDWAGLHVDENDGRVYRYGAPGRPGSWEAYRDSAYLTITVRKNPASENRNLVLPAYSVLLRALEADAATTAEQRAALQAALIATMDQRYATRRFDQLNGQLNSLTDASIRWAQARRAHLPPATGIEALLANSGCDGAMGGSREINLARTCEELEAQALEFLTDFGEALSDMHDPPETSRELSPRNRDLLVRRARAHLALAGEDLAGFSHTSFRGCDEDNPLCFDVSQSPQNFSHFVDALKESGLRATAGE